MNTTTNAAASIANIRAVDFKRRPYQKVKGYKGLYTDPQTGAFYHRPFIERRRTWLKLTANTKTLAFQEATQNRLHQAMARKGLAQDPYKTTDTLPIDQLCQLYIRAGCPKIRSTYKRTREPHGQKETLAHLQMLSAWWAKIPIQTIDTATCEKYYRWRLTKITRANCTGERQVDRELTTLSAVLHWAHKNKQRTGVTSNPLAKRETFHSASSVRHCRDFQPENADELHALARYLFQTPDREVLGWQLLFESMIGQRTHEILRLRADAKTTDHPGHIHAGHLFLYRSKTEKGTYGFCEIHPALQKTIDAHRAWLRIRHPESPWYFPSPTDPTKPINKYFLTKTLAKITPAMGLPHRTSHGLRAYCVNVHRSNKIPDGEIALMIGQTSGGKLIVTTYGEKLPYKLTWTPKENPAWNHFANLRKPADPPAPKYLQLTLPEMPELIQAELPL